MVLALKMRCSLRHLTKTDMSCCCDSSDATFLTWLSDSENSCSSPVAAAIPSRARPDTGTWHLRTCKWISEKEELGEVKSHRYQSWFLTISNLKWPPCPCAAAQWGEGSSTPLSEIQTGTNDPSGSEWHPLPPPVGGRWQTVRHELGDCTWHVPATAARNSANIRLYREGSSWTKSDFLFSVSSFLMTIYF